MWPRTCSKAPCGTTPGWAVAGEPPLLDPVVATNMLESAVRHTPGGGEPQMVLAQLYLAAGRKDEAKRAAASALQLFSAWGNSWDKRVQWDAWVAWTRILLQGATVDGAWP